MTAPDPAPTAADLIGCYEGDDDDGVVVAYPALTDAVRADAWEALRKPLSRAFHFLGDQALPHEAALRRARTRALLALAIGPSDVARIVGTRVIGEPESDAIIAARSAAWRAGFVTATLRSWAAEREVGLFGPAWWDWWRWLRRQERERLLPVDPASADYLVLMVRGLSFSGAIVDAIGQDAALAAGPVWALFEPAPAVQKALLGSERFWNPANTWRVALVRLALAGVLDRDRLERAAAAASSDRRMGPGHRAWYRGIPDLLRDPTGLPTAPARGAPPPGNQLYPRTRDGVDA